MNRLFRSVIAIFTIVLSLYGESNETTRLPLPDGDEATQSGSPSALFMRYENIGQTIHKNQIFSVTVSALLPDTQFDELSSTLSNYKNVKILNNELNWVSKDPSTYTLTLTMKALAESIKTPDIQTLLKTLDGQAQSTQLQGVTLKTTPLISNPTLYCGVLAQSLAITSFKIDKYDQSHNIVVLEIDARMGNLEDFHLTNAVKQGIDSIKVTAPTTKMFYYAIVPNTQQQLEFEYYNTSIESFEALRIAIDPSKISDQSVSTQTDINPRTSNANLFKVLGLIGIVIIFGYFYRKKQSNLFLIPILLSITGLIFLLFPNEKISVKAGTNVYLLPTAKATIFMKIPAPTTVKMLKTVDGYTKIQLTTDDKIGWVKNDDIQ